MVKDKYTVYAVIEEEMEVSKADIAEWIDTPEYEGRTVEDLSDEEIRAILNEMAREEWFGVTEVIIDE